MVAISHQKITKVFPSATSTGARRFVGKTAVIAGASANVGRALAELLAQEGADIVVHYNSAHKQTQAEETAAAVRKLGPRGVTVNCIAPGPLDTSFFYPAESDENIAWLRSMSIDGGIGNIADITGLALYLVSPEARWMTGTTSFINGGIVSPIN